MDTYPADAPQRKLDGTSPARARKSALYKRGEGCASAVRTRATAFGSRKSYRTADQRLRGSATGERAITFGRKAASPDGLRIRRGLF